jgi:hypothetical protein
MMRKIRVSPQTVERYRPAPVPGGAYQEGLVFDSLKQRAFLYGTNDFLGVEDFQLEWRISEVVERILVRHIWAPTWVWLRVS